MSYEKVEVVDQENKAVVVGCPDLCKHRDFLCVDCVDGCFFDGDAQE